MTQQLSEERFMLAHGFRSFSPAGWGRDGRMDTGCIKEAGKPGPFPGNPHP